MNEQEFLKFLNAIVNKVTNYSATDIQLKSMSDDFESAGLDSLEMILVNMHICDALKIPGNIDDSIQATTAKELYDFLLKAQVVMPETAEDALSVLA